MTEQTAAPFDSFSFTLIEDKRPRSAFRMAVQQDGTYELHVEKGSASNPSSQFTRTIPRESAQKLKDALDAIGVFGWEEAYGNRAGAPARRWNITTVFKEGVFTVASKGRSETPAGFDSMLEELYRLDFPRPVAQAKQAGAGIGNAIRSMGASGIGGLSAGDLGAYGAAGKIGDALGNAAEFGRMPGAEGIDFSQIADLMNDIDASEMSRLFAEAQNNPQAMQQRMRDEFAHMTPDEQNRLLDSLSASGMASRAWWERFFRGL